LAKDARCFALQNDIRSGGEFRRKRISSTNVLAAAFPTGLMAIGLDLPDNLAAGAYSNSPWWRIR